MTVRILTGDCREVLKTLPDASVDSIVTDPPYELGFMGNAWDRTGVANDPAVWRECLRVIKPGGHLLAFGGTRTQHRMVCAIEDSGFEIRDQALWCFASGFPKSLDVSKAIDKHLGAKREVVGTIPDRWTGKGNILNFSTGRPKAEVAVTGEAVTGEAVTGEAVTWQGWGTALKPAWEPICVARKPLKGTVAANVLAHGTGALNIDGCRVPMSTDDAERIENMGGFGRDGYSRQKTDATFMQGTPNATASIAHQLGRWPANLLHDGSPEVVALFPKSDGQQGDPKGQSRARSGSVYSTMTPAPDAPARGDRGSAARFFWCPKTSRHDRNDGTFGMPERMPHGPSGDGRAWDVAGSKSTARANFHPTVKPTELMRYLCRLVTPPGGTVLDPFMGSGSTIKAAELEGFSAIGIELDPAYVEIAKRRIAADAPLFSEVEDS